MGWKYDKFEKKIQNYDRDNIAETRHITSSQRRLQKNAIRMTGSLEVQTLLGYYYLNNFVHKKIYNTKN